MLDATIYVKALNHAAFTDKSDASLERLKRIIDYCRAHGLRLATVPDGGLTVERDGMEPSALHILIDGRTGWDRRALPNRRGYAYLEEMWLLEPLHRTEDYWACLRDVRSWYTTLYSDDPTSGQFNL